jgi:ferric-dicitrate binding protein FerR (iron transport regulator)
MKFLVHTFDKLTIEVLGTSFNVNDGEDKIIVVLQQGSIKLEIDDEGDSNKTQLYLKPGEMISYNKRKGDYTKRVVDTEKFDSWVNGTLKMDNYSLRDASAFMKQLFGKKLIIVDTALMAYRISGSMPIVYSEDTMLIQFAKAFNVHLKKDGQKIRVEKNNP